MSEVPSRLAPAGGRAASTRLLSLTIGWHIAAVVWLTLAPLNCGSSLSPIRLVPPRDAIEVLGNLLLLVPAAVAIVACIGRTGRPSRLGPVPVTILICLALSMALETGQLFVAGRIVSPYDIALNATGAAIAATVIAAPSRSAGRQTRVVIALSLLVFVSVLFYVTWAAVDVRDRFRLQGWDASMKIATAAEVDGSRDYAGAVEAAQLCAGQPSGGTCITGAAAVESRLRFVDAAIASQRVQVSALVRSATSRQTGPARIVTFSTDPNGRNVTLAQEGRALVLRLRTPLTGDNGARPEFRLPRAIPTNERVRVRALFERGTVLLEAQHDSESVRGALGFDLLTSWLLHRELPWVTPWNLRIGTFLMAIVLFVPIGMAAGALAVRWPAAVVVAGASGVALPLAIHLVVGAPVLPGSILAATGIAAAAAWLARWKVRSGGRFRSCEPPELDLSSDPHSAVAPPL